MGGTWWRSSGGGPLARADRPAGRAQRRVYGLLVLLGSVALTCLVLELSLRAILREEAVNGNYWGRGAFEAFPGAGYRHASGFEGFAYRQGVFDSPVRTSTHGLRQSDLDVQLAFPELILLLGDSYTFGIGVEERETFAHHLAVRFNPLQIGVVNGGQTGYSAAQEAVFGRWLAERLDPGRVSLIVQCLFPENDVYDDWARPYERIDVHYGYRLPASRWPAATPFDYLRTHSYLWLFIDGRVNRIHARRAWRTFRAEARTDPEGVVQPTLEAVRELSAFAASQSIAHAVVLVERVGAAREYREPLKQGLLAAGYPLLDLEGSAFEPSDQFVGDAHWNARGHRKAARYIGDFVLDLLSGLEERSGQVGQEEAEQPGVSALRDSPSRRPAPAA